jgi:hypothetical protein
MEAMHHLSLEIVFLVWNIPFRMPDWGEKNECLPGVPGIVSEKSHDFHDGKDVWRTLFTWCAKQYEHLFVVQDASFISVTSPGKV